jgi:hypothetical protein
VKKTVDQILGEYRAKYGELEPLLEEGLRESIEYSLAHPDEVDEPTETLMELGARLERERKAKKKQAS